ncbi:MAG TPA: hypothetical protein P5280_05095 [Cyclobacteriaceae bacterium]|nr:hypothetical protein [Cyclobacteriaceae bacterium]
MSASDRHKDALSTKGYFRRAKIFGYLMLIVALRYLIYYLYEIFIG